MSLGVHLSSTPDPGADIKFPATTVDLVRAMGSPVIWRVRANVDSESVGVEDVPRLAKKLEAGPVYAAPTWRDDPIGPSGVIVGLGYEDERRTILNIEAHATWPDKESPEDPFLPRRRVHRVKSFRELSQALQNVAEVSRSVGNRLSEEQFCFKDEGHASIIQDDISDWELVHSLIAQYFEQETETKYKPLALFGSLNRSKGRERRWMIDWAEADAYSAVNDVNDRLVDPNELGGFEQLEFSQSQILHQTDFPTANRPFVVRRWARLKGDLDKGRYKEWGAREVPLFLGRNGPMVSRVEDRIAQAGREDIIGWTTLFHTSPIGMATTTGADRFGRAQRFTTHWSRVATVSKSSPEGPWITVRLPGFESGTDELEVRLTTPYSGTDGKKGVHLVPEEGTAVIVFWSGRFGDTPFCLPNVRVEAADLESPSLWLEKTSQVHLEDVNVKYIGTVHVESDVSIELDQRSNIGGRQPMQFDVNGVQVKLSGGIFHTGKA